MPESDQTSEEILATDIVFECPHCGKSLVIEEAGAGMEVCCPDCQSWVIVPGEKSSDAPSPSQVRTATPAEKIDQLRRKLEILRREAALIQASVDRMMNALQD